MDGILNINRTLIAVIDNEQISPKEARKRMASLFIKVILCDNPTSDELIAFETVLLTAYKCFEGRVLCETQFRGSNIEDLISKYGTRSVERDPVYTIRIGSSPVAENDIQLLVSGWVGGVNMYDVNGKYAKIDRRSTNVPFGAVYAAGLSLNLIFQDFFGIKPMITHDTSCGLSLWDLSCEDWTKSQNPNLGFSPEKLWFAGLGHLGQANLYVLSKIPFSHYPEILLQDDQKSGEENLNTQLLTNEVGKMKTRICCQFLETVGFEARLLESRLTQNTISDLGGKYKVLLTGFDNLESRLALKKSDLSLLIDAGVGGSLSSYDSISIYSLADDKSGKDIWENLGEEMQEKSHYRQQVEQIEGCGKAASISTPFVGLCAAALSLSEVYRAYNKGFRHDLISFQLRYSKNNAENRGSYGTEIYSHEYLKV